MARITPFTYLLQVDLEKREKRPKERQKLEMLHVTTLLRPWSTLIDTRLMNIESQGKQTLYINKNSRKYGAEEL